jgi:hypothetical protein
MRRDGVTQGFKLVWGTKSVWGTNSMSADVTSIVVNGENQPREHAARRAIRRIAGARPVSEVHRGARSED